MRLIRFIIACAATGVLVTTFSPIGVSLASNQSPRSSSCKHPVTEVLKPGEQHKENGSPNYYLTVFRTNGGYPIVEWGGEPYSNYIVCSARIQLRNGKWVGPTQVKPNNTPIPKSGKYIETGNPRSRFRKVVVKFAEAPISKGSSCNYPLTSTSVGGEAATEYSVGFRVGVPSPEQVELDVTIHNPQIVICSAVVEERGGLDSAITLRVFHPAIAPNGGLSSPLPKPIGGNGSELFAWVYARWQ